MRIGIDCRAAGDPSGVGVYIRGLLGKLLEIDRHNDYVLFFFDDGADLEAYRWPNVSIIFLPAEKIKRFLPIIYSHFWLAWVFRKERLDVCLFPANVIPLGYRGRSVLTVHDLAVYKFPELFPEQKINFDRRVVVPAALKRAAQIIAVSENTRRDIVDLFKISVDKIKVVYEGTVQPSSALPRLDQPVESKYFLFLGTIEPRKNIGRLIEAFKKFVQATDWPGELILAGGRGWKNQAIFEALGACNADLGRAAVKHLGYVSAEARARLYHGALAFVFPSLYEGFGLPVLEAMAAGAPVIVSDRSSLPEVAGEAAITIDPLDVAGLAAAMRQLAFDEELRRDLSQRGQKKSREFTWEKCAQETLAVLESGR
ncbi:MAG: glycosyltransferase family 1 protein [Patescibacteria group bacterium]